MTHLTVDQLVAAFAIITRQELAIAERDRTIAGLDARVKELEARLAAEPPSPTNGHKTPARQSVKLDKE